MIFKGMVEPALQLAMSHQRLSLWSLLNNLDF